jgi:hypothetical protein
MRRAELMRLFVKSDTPAAPKSASQPDPFGLIVRHNLNMGALYFGYLNLSSLFLIFFKKNFNVSSRCSYNRHLDCFPANRFLIIPNPIEGKTQSTSDNLQWQSCRCQQINISKRGRRPQPHARHGHFPTLKTCSQIFVFFASFYRILVKRGRRPQPIVFAALLLFITTSTAYPVILNAGKSYFDLFCIDENFPCNDLAVAKSKGLPEISNPWRLNQQFSETILLGQSADSLFQEIDKNK